MAELIRFAILGLGVGATYALAAQGLVLIYRGSGVLNFAHGAVGVVGAYTFFELRKTGTPYGFSLLAGLAICAVLGAAIHLLVMRPLRGASSIIRLVATLAVLIILQSLLLLRYGSANIIVHSELPVKPIHLPGDIVVTLDRPVLLLIAIGVTVVLWAVYRWTRFGMATSAVAENQRVAASLGWSPDLIATVNWAAGSALAGGAAILIIPIVTLQVNAITTLVIGSLAAALAGGFTSFPKTLAAAVVIGVLVAELTRVDVTGLSSSVPFLVIVVLLVFRGRSLPLRDFMLERLPTVGDGWIRWRYLVPGLLCSLVFFLLTPTRWVNAGTTTVCVGIVVLSLVVLTGYAGQVSLGQYAIAGIGAYLAGRLAVDGAPFPVALVGGVLATALVGMIFAIPAVRTRGVNLAVITLGLGSAVEAMLFANTELTGGTAGLAVGPTKILGLDVNALDHPRSYAVMCLVLFTVATLASANLRRGASGRRMIAVRANERGAASLGISVAGTKVHAFAVSSGVAALGGILLAFRTPTVVFTDFIGQSINMVAYAIIGGVGFLVGPALGSILAAGGLGTIALTSLLQDVENVGTYLPLAGGLVLLALLFIHPDGLASALARPLRRFHAVNPADAALVSSPSVPDPHHSPRERDGTIGAAGGPRLSTLSRDPGDVMLEASGLQVRYGSVKAVGDLSLSVRAGEVVGLIGPNGAGKTSVIDALTGFTRTSAGTIKLAGRAIHDISPTRRARRGLVRSFQSLELFEDMTVEENLRAASDPRSVLSYLLDLLHPRSAQLPMTAQDAVRDFELADHLDTKVSDLSYGRRRLLAIARAVATGPQVLLLDEPAAGLDDVETAELSEVIRRMAREGLAVLLIEHDMTLVGAVCDQLVVMDFGRTIATGTWENVRQDPAVVEAYLGTPPKESADSTLARNLQ